MFGFIKNFFIGLLSACTTASLGESLVSNFVLCIKCISLSNRPCQARTGLVDINSKEPLFYGFTVSVDKCRGSNTIDDPYAQICVLDKVRKMNLKVFNVMSGVNETKFLVQHESCGCTVG